MKSDELNVRRIERIYGEYGARVYGFCYRLCGNASDAEDLTAETFLAVCRGISRFQSRSKLRTWLFQIALHKYRDLVARPKVPTVPLEEETERALLFAPDDRIALEQAIRRLSSEEREAILLVKIEGLKHREAAVVLGIPQGTVQSRVFEGIAKLRRFCEIEPCASEAPPERCVHEV